MKNQIHWLKKEELKLAEFLKNSAVKKATTEEYIEFLNVFFKNGGKLTSYNEKDNEDMLIVDSGTRIPNLISIAAKKIIVRKGSSTAEGASKDFNSSTLSVGENIIYHMHDGSVDGYKRLSISKNILSLLKFRSMSLNDTLALFHEDKELPEALRGEEKRKLNKLKEDYLSINTNPPMALKRDLPLRKRIKF